MDWSDFFFPFILRYHSQSLFSHFSPITVHLLSSRWAVLRLSISMVHRDRVCIPQQSFPNTYPWPDYLILQREWEFCPYLWSFTPAPFQLYTADWLSWSMLWSQRVIPAKQSTDTHSSDPHFLTRDKTDQRYTLTHGENIIITIYNLGNNVTNVSFLPSWVNATMLWLLVIRKGNVSILGLLIWRLVRRRTRRESFLSRIFWCLKDKINHTRPKWSRKYFGRLPYQLHEYVSQHMEKYAAIFTICCYRRWMIHKNNLLKGNAAMWDKSDI